MSAVLELTEKSTENGNGIYVKKPHLFTVETYDLMIKHGILTENDNVELLDGEIIEKMPKGARHCYLNDLIGDVLKEKLGVAAYIRTQNSIVLGDFSEPEPDILVCKPPRTLYANRLPTSDDILLILEIADSTLYLDRNNKGNAYSRAGIEQYLIVNVENNTIEDYRQPSVDGFQWKQTYKIGDKFSLVAFPEIEIKAADFFQNEG